MSVGLEVGDQFRGVFQKFRSFQGESIVTNSADNVFQILADNFGIKYLFNLKFNGVVDNYWGWGRLFVSSEWVGSCGFKKIYVEYWVGPHGSGEVQLICMARNLLLNLKSP